MEDPGDAVLAAHQSAAQSNESRRLRGDADTKQDSPPALLVVVHPSSDDSDPEWPAECSIHRKGAMHAL